MIRVSSGSGSSSPGSSCSEILQPIPARRSLDLESANWCKPFCSRETAEEDCRNCERVLQMPRVDDGECLAEGISSASALSGTFVSASASLPTERDDRRRDLPRTYSF